MVEGMFDEYRPLSLYREHRGLIMFNFNTTPCNVENDLTAQNCWNLKHFEIIHTVILFADKYT